MDGFDRTQGGSWNQPNHFFAFTHGQAVVANGFSFDTAANEAILDGTIHLNDYKAVIWILGDESTADETFSAAEQTLVKNYLENGGNLFVSGSEIAWDLDQDNNSSGSTPADEQFLHEYLKADYVGDDSGILSVTGVNGTIFEGLSFNYGTNPYPEDFPDYLNSFGAGAVVNLKYSATKNAAIQYVGTFGNGAIPGKLVYIAFPFETITGEANRTAVMGRILEFFFPITSVESEPSDNSTQPKKFALLQNYPNPFNPETTIEYHLPITSKITLTIYNALGQKVRTLMDEVATSGVHRKTWNGLNDAQAPVASGFYLVQIKAEAITHSKKKIFKDSRRMLLVR